MNSLFGKHWQRLKRSLARRWKEWRLPKGYVRLGTRYGGWWLDRNGLSPNPLLIDCGLGEDISFPTEFLALFHGKVVGIEPNPRSLAYCQKHCPVGMEVWPLALWNKSGETLTFHIPRPQELLPQGADGVSGSLVDSHIYVNGGVPLQVQTISFEKILADCQKKECDILKMDIEGAEYDVLSHLAATGGLRQARQVLVEFHHDVTHHSLRETESVVDSVLNSGFHLIHTEGRNYIFRRNDLG